MAHRDTFVIEEFLLQVPEALNSIDPETPIASFQTFEVAAGQVPAFLEHASALIQAFSLNGDNVFTLSQSLQPQAPSAIRFLLQGNWENCYLCLAQWNSGRMQEFLRAVAPLTVIPPDLRLYFEWRKPLGAASSEPPHDLCSSAINFSYAMSLFGAQQMTNLFTPSKSTASFDNLSRAVQAELSGPFRSAFHSGDGLQRGFVDFARGGLNGQFLDPGRWMRAFAKIMQPAAAGCRASLGTATPGYASAPPQTAENNGFPITPRVNASPSVVSASPVLNSGNWGPMPASPPNATTTFANAPTSQARASENLPGETPALPPTPIGEADISPDYPFEPRYAEVFGSRMHYIEQGHGQTILLIHGNPSWSYCWRNIIPHLSPLGRCIAPDLIGFGKSDKPGIEYMWFDHVRYLERFIEAMNLRDMILVLHDQGSALGLHYAMRHQSKVKAIAFFEALVRPFTWENFSTPQFRELFRQFRTGDEGGLGWKLIVEQNMFIEQLLPQAAGRTLSEKEMNYYREPFRYPPSRLPIWRFPRQTAIGGQPKDVWDAVTEYSEKLQESAMPKLMLYATPGALLTPEHVQWCQQNIRNLKWVDIGPGFHFLDESSPNRIGREIAAWIPTLAQAA